MGKTPHDEGIPKPGETVGERYEVCELLARGGMGGVVRARHLLLDQDVVIKFVLDRSGSSRGRLLREARAMRSLTSQHVVEVFDLGMHEGAPYIVMELLQGEDLRDRVEREGPMGIEDAVDCVLESAVAVHEAHSLGIVHRDLKPANLFLARTRQRELVKVLDFGISKVPEGESIDDVHATTEDTVLGTPHFMSPEQLRNPARIDARTDVWALGVTLFYLLTGELPFRGDTRRELMAAIFADQPIRLADLRAEAPADLGEVIAAALVKRPEARLPSVAALAERLVVHASARGQQAREHIESELAGEPAPPRGRSSDAGAITSATTAFTVSEDARLEVTTESGLSASLLDSSASAPPPPTARAPSRAWLAALGLLAVGAGTWMVRATPPAPSAATGSAVSPPGAPTPSTGLAAPVLVLGPPPSAAPFRAEAPEAAAPEAEAPEPVATEAEPPDPRARAAPRAAPRAPRPPPAPSPPVVKPPATAAPAPSRQLDIDGLPIIE